MPGDVVEVKSSNVQQDLFLALQQFQRNQTEQLGADDQRITGKSTNRTATQDQIAALGTQIREGGLVDKVRDWLVHQSQIEGELLKQYSNGPVHFQITKKDFSNPVTRQSAEQEWVEFLTPNQPLPLRQALEGEFDFRVNIYEAIKPNKLILKQEYDEFLALATNPNLRMAMLQDSSARINIGEIIKARLQQFEHIDAEAAIEQLDPQQQAAAQASEVLMQNKGVPPQRKPSPEEASALKQEEAIVKESAKAQNQTQGAAQ